jgi:hypothetical protein
MVQQTSPLWLTPTNLTYTPYEGFFVCSQTSMQARRMQSSGSFTSPLALSAPSKQCPPTTTTTFMAVGIVWIACEKGLSAS